MKKLISSLIVVGSLMVSPGVSAIEPAYVAVQYGNLTFISDDLKMKNIGTTLGFHFSENLFIEGQISVNLSEYEESERISLGSRGSLDNPVEYWGTHKESFSAQFFGVFATYKIEKESIYGKARLGLASVDVDWNESRDFLNEDDEVRSKSESESYGGTGFAFGIGGGIFVGPGAIEFEYTELPDADSGSVKFISLGYVYPL